MMFQLYFSIQDVVQRLEFAENRIDVWHRNPSIIAYKLLGDWGGYVDSVLVIVDKLFQLLPLERIEIETDFQLSRAGHPELTLRVSFRAVPELPENQLSSLDQCCSQLFNEHALQLQKSLDGKYLLFDWDFEYL